MDREQAIEKLNDIRCHVKETSTEEQALVMAIDALKAQLSMEDATKGATSDTISRKAALEALESQRTTDRTDTGFVQNMTVRECIERVRNLPTIQPEPKEGHWINGKCDRCGEHAPFWAMASTYHESNYCPNCGAKMKGVRYETD